MKVAIVHDWYKDNGGAENVVKSMLKLYPEADLFSSVDFFDDRQRDIYLNGKEVRTTFIQNLPFSKGYKKYFPLMPIAMEALDFSAYDLILSSSSSVAKGIITSPDQVHVCYCHSPMRYAWDLQEQYLRELGLASGFKSFWVRSLLFFMRNWDVRSSYSVDCFLANSKYVSNRIKKFYRRDSVVVNPPVDIEGFDFNDGERGDYYFTCSRMVPYKRIDLIVSAFKLLPNKKLIVIGDGPEMKRIAGLAGRNVTLMGYQSFEVLKKTMRYAKAFIFCAEEDFGIVPLESQACGTPVIAYGKGGALETVVDGKTGCFFYEQSELSIVDAISRFECMELDGQEIRLHAEGFSEERFINEMRTEINIALENNSRWRA